MQFDFCERENKLLKTHTVGSAVLTAYSSSSSSSKVQDSLECYRTSACTWCDNKHTCTSVMSHQACAHIFYSNHKPKLNIACSVYIIIVFRNSWRKIHDSEKFYILLLMLINFWCWGTEIFATLSKRLVPWSCWC